jgi:hypothetical protein
MVRSATRIPTGKKRLETTLMPIRNQPAGKPMAGAHGVRSASAVRPIRRTRPRAAMGVMEITGRITAGL